MFDSATIKSICEKESEFKRYHLTFPKKSKIERCDGFISENVWQQYRRPRPVCCLRRRDRRRRETTQLRLRKTEAPEKSWRTTLYQRCRTEISIDERLARDQGRDICWPERAWVDDIVHQNDISPAEALHDVLATLKNSWDKLRCPWILSLPRLGELQKIHSPISLLITCKWRKNWWPNFLIFPKLLW